MYVCVGKGASASILISLNGIQVPTDIQGSGHVGGYYSLVISLGTVLFGG